MKPTTFPEVNQLIAEHQDQYLKLPAAIVGDAEGQVITCWQLSLWERLKVLLTGRVWLRQLTFGQPLQPQLPEIDCPFHRTRPGYVMTWRSALNRVLGREHHGGLYWKEKLQ